MTSAAEILEAALKLEENERAQLLERLSASLHGIDLGDEWEAEIRQRILEVDSGQVQTVPGDAVLERLERRFGGR
jgi:putative addiction module component (TIGR02574 family)